MSKPLPDLRVCTSNANKALASALQRASANVESPPDASSLDALALAAHELRSPASIVSGYLRLLQQDASGLTPRQLRMVDEAGRACARMLRLIQEIGELTTLEGGVPSHEPAGVPVFALCDEALSSGEMAAGAARRPVFVCADSDRPALVNGNAAWLKRAFTALMAATAREDGSVPLECHGFISGNGGTPIAVVAFGPSGLASNHERLVAHRHTFDRWRGGTGLSLPIACRIIEAHGGSVWSPAAADARVSVWSVPLLSPAAAPLPDGERT